MLDGVTEAVCVVIGGVDAPAGHRQWAPPSGPTLPYPWPTRHSTTPQPHPKLTPTRCPLCGGAVYTRLDRPQGPSCHPPSPASSAVWPHPLQTCPCALPEREQGLRLPLSTRASHSQYLGPPRPNCTPRAPPQRAAATPLWDGLSRVRAVGCGL